MSEKIKEGIQNYLTPILISIVGYMLVQSMGQIKRDIEHLQQVNERRDEWVRDWTAEWQPTLQFSRAQMEYKIRNK